MYVWKYCINIHRALWSSFCRIHIYSLAYPPNRTAFQPRCRDRAKTVPAHIFPPLSTRPINVEWTIPWSFGWESNVLPTASPRFIVRPRRHICGRLRVRLVIRCCGLAAGCGGVHECDLFTGRGLTRHVAVDVIRRQLRMRTTAETRHSDGVVIGRQRVVASDDTLVRRRDFVVSRRPEQPNVPNFREEPWELGVGPSGCWGFIVSFRYDGDPRPIGIESGGRVNPRWFGLLGWPAWQFAVVVAVQKTRQWNHRQQQKCVRRYAAFVSLVTVRRIVSRRSFVRSVDVLWCNPVAWSLRKRRNRRSDLWGRCWVDIRQQSAFESTAAWFSNVRKWKQ